ncbi:AraC family transcriptional regulator [Sphingosinicella rhizophila]|uniref:AraC family transcriptional regulator n=1 Tax=Sphingosinicella rhizophila TaxID=3050082 RepID=A0ABU3QA28_9SPHN|nr:AraC family transcriptional regulator [Sphingosinicella sp. GR2756]MDT9600177.1 AraC family transcriptional regulator [Sphingosinicella sp. GR2756]
MKLTGSVFLEAEFTAPWCVSSRITPEDCAAYFPTPEHVIAYHYVLEGNFLCRVGDDAPIEVRSGEILLLPRNEEHHIGSCLSADPINAHELIVPAEAGGLAKISWGGGGDVAALLCGFLGTATPVNSFILSLPPILAIDASAGAAGEWLVSSIRYATRETLAGSPEVVGKLAELLFMEAVRQFVADLPEDQKGWFGGLRDPHVSRAMTLLHTRCADSWTAGALAREVGLSRTVLNERFSHYLGEPPMRYLAKWRMNQAANLLREDQQNACNVAYAVGFNSEAAFNRAFKREFGMPPAAWRREKCKLN